MIISLKFVFGLTKQGVDEKGCLRNTTYQFGLDHAGTISSSGKTGQVVLFPTVFF